MRYIISLLLLVGMSIPAWSQNYQTELDSAAYYYSNGAYEKVIAQYEGILGEGYHSAEVYYNLGNAYYKSNKFVQAIINYERALKLSPNDGDIAFNLKLANTHVVDKLDVVPEFFLNSWRDKFNQMLDSNTWAYMSLIIFILSLVLLLLFFFSGRMLLRKITFWSAMVFLLAFLLSFNAARKNKWVAEKEPDAIVVTPSVTVKSAPNAVGTELFLIHEGLKIKVIDQLDDWRRIQLSNGNKGWLKASDLVII